MVKILTDLGFIVVIVTGLCWYFDFGDVCMLRYVRCPLTWNSTPPDAGDYTLHELELRDLPIVDRIFLSLTTSGPELKDDIFIFVELPQSIVDNSYVIVIDSMGLDSVAEVHEGTDCSDKPSRRGSTDHAHNVALDITMDAACNLFQFSDTAFVVLKPNSWLQNRKSEIDLSSANNVNTPLNVVVSKHPVEMVEELRSEKPTGTCE